MNAQRVDRDLVERGRQEVLRIAAALILVELGMLASALTYLGMGEMFWPSVRLALMVMLVVKLYNGVVWARRVLIGLLLYAFVVGNWDLPQTWEQLARDWVSVVVLLLYLVIASALLFSRALAAFMRVQRGGTPGPRPDI